MSGGPRFLAVVRTVAAKDLAVELRTGEATTGMALLSLIVLVAFNFALETGTVDPATVLPGVLWTTLFFGALVGLSRSMRLEAADGALGAVLSTAADRAAVYLGKVLANLASLTLLQIVVVPVAFLLFGGTEPGNAVPLAAVFVTHGVAIACVGTLLAALATRVGRGEALLAILLFPTTTPILISGVRCTRGILEGLTLSDPTVGGWLRLAAGFGALYLFVGLATFGAAVEE